jgi:hypothetical protein
MNPTSKAMPNLADIEREVVAQSREWGRQRLEERLQKLADEHGEVFPPKATARSNPDAPQRVGRDKTRR